MISYDDRMMALVQTYETGSVEDFDELAELVLNEDFNMVAVDIEYAIKTDDRRMKGKEFLYVKAITPSQEKINSCIPVDFLTTTILQDGFESLKFYGKENPSIKRDGRLVSTKRQLFNLFVKLGVLAKTNYPYYYKQAFETEPYKDFLSQYFSYELLRDKEIENYQFTLDNQSDYFRNKAEILKGLGANNEWRLHAVLDTLGYGKCTLGHDLRYKYVVMDNFGNTIEFGRKCVQDFFLVNGQVQRDLLKFVYTLRVLQSDYLNAYLTDYDLTYGVEQAFINNAINKLKDNDDYKLDLQYAKGFITNGLPIPRLLSYRLTVALASITNKSEFIKGTKTKHYLATVGLNGVPPKFYKETDKIAISMLGDRIPPKIWNNDLFPSLRQLFGFSLDNENININEVQGDLLDEYLTNNIGFAYDSILYSKGFNIEKNTYKEINVPSNWIDQLIENTKLCETKEQVYEYINNFLYSSGLDLISKSMENELKLHYKLVARTTERTKELMLPIYRSLDISYINENLTTILTITDYNDILDFLSRPFLKAQKGEREAILNNAIKNVQSYETMINGSHTELVNAVKTREDNKSRYQNERPKIFFLKMHSNDIDNYFNKIIHSVRKYSSLSEKQWAILEKEYNRLVKEKTDMNPKYLEEFNENYGVR